MIDLDAGDLTAEQRYKLLTGAVTPRPIAWISTLNADGGVNLAPFSCYTYISPDPPLVVISIGGRLGVKDTLSNAQRTGEFTVNTVHEALLRPVADSSRRYPHGVSEADDLAVRLAPGRTVAVPRVADALVSLECVVHRVVDVGDAYRHNLLIGRVLCFRVSERIYADGKIDMAEYPTIGRLGGPLYRRPGDIVKMEPTKDARFTPPKDA